MSRPNLKDQAARDKIESSLDQTFLVEAGAGSGKTAGLVMRMIALLASGSCEPEKMTAVTFTRKAAGELKERFQLGLEERWRRESDPKVKERLAEALEKIERIFAGTIHSFCARLLRERPIEAGLAPDFTEIEGLEEQLLEERAWEEYLVEVGANCPDKLVLLDEMDLSHSDLEEAFKKLNLYPDVEIKKEKVNKPDLCPVRRDLDRFFKKAQTMLRKDEPDNGWDGLQDAIITFQRWQNLFDLHDDRYMLRLLNNLKGKGDVTYNRWTQDKDEVEALKDEFDLLRDNQIKPVLDEWLTNRHYYLLQFLEPAVERYREMRLRENLLNYQDLLMLTAKLLRENSEVRAYFQERFTHLLVDEFQDTDPIQAEIMFYLTGEELGEREWTRLTPKPGSLFVVGDPKQSIYRFRRADIATYNQVKELIANSGGEILTLSSNFRSLPGLIEWGNTAFEELFDPIASPYQADFTAMDDDLVNKNGCTEGLLQLPVSKISGNYPKDIAAADAEQVAEWIEKAIGGGIKLSRSNEELRRGLDEKAQAGDFLVIVSKKKNMTLYARALEKRGIAFSLSGGGDLEESEELKELLNLLKTLADPENPVPLVATLRGPFFGFSDDLLYRFKRAGGQFNFLTPVPGRADPDLYDRFNAAMCTLLRYRDWVKNLPPASAIEKIIEELGLIPYALAGEMGRGRAGSIVQALELLRSREGHGEFSFGGAVDYLERVLEEGVDEELDIDGGSTSAVRIINLHKAKGLEAPVVILANPGNHKVYDPELHVTRSAGSAEGYLVIGKTKDDYGNKETLALPPQWDRWGAEEEIYRDAEYVRLLYVAATRARNVLAISTYQGNPEKSPWRPLEKYLNENNCRDVFSALLPAESGMAAGGQQVDQPEPISAGMKQDVEELIGAGIGSMKEPTYRQISGAALHSGEELPERQKSGRGTAWGIAVHDALEYLVGKMITAAENGAGVSIGTDQGALEKAIEAAVREVELPETQEEELKVTLNRVVASDFWQRVTAASDVMTEVPFGLWENDTYKTGIVDLAYRENGAWVLVDYKSDSIESEEHRQALVDHYRPQLELYRKSWEAITGEEVVECALYFTDQLFYIEV